MANAPLDLSQLALNRAPSGEPSSIRPRRKRWLTRYVLPLGILLGFVALLSVAAGRRLLPSTSVTVVPVIVKKAEVQHAGTTLFQSPGWIEPRPTAISVAALTPGIVEELLVVEGQYVEKNEPIARLISIDAELMVEQAQNSLAIREGELNRAKAELTAANVRVANPIHLQIPLADAESVLAKARTEIAGLPFLITAAEADLEYARSSLDGKRLARDAVSGRVIAKAESDYAAAQAALQALQSRKANLQREVDALTNKVEALKQQLKLLVEETRQVAEANAKIQSAIAMRDEAKLQVRQANLALERNVIRAPMNGRVLRLLAAPGTRVMGLESTAGQSSSTVIEMYDPQRLQVRADVRLEDVPMVSKGQPVQIETASNEGLIHGRVLQTTSTANIQKNTLEVKVELLNPPPSVSPEMLVTATFLAPAIENETREATETERMFVPQQLVQSNGSGAFVWIVDANAMAQRQMVDVGSQTSDGLIEVKDGLNVTDKLVASGFDNLRQHSRVTVTGDDQTIGIK